MGSCFSYHHRKKHNFRLSNCVEWFVVEVDGQITQIQDFFTLESGVCVLCETRQLNLRRKSELSTNWKVVV